MSLPKPYYDDGKGIVIYHGDCLEIAPHVHAEAVVSDPPYGMEWDADTTRFSGGGLPSGRGREASDVIGDASPFDPSPWSMRFRWCVLWGYHHFATRVECGTVLSWIKKPPSRFGTFLGDADLAWRKGGHGVYCYFLPWGGVARGSERDEHWHPTQKPVGLMTWCIEKSGAPTEATILDPYMGSGTTLVAAKELGRKAIGIEIEERYCAIAAKRLAQGVFDMRECDADPR